jgi:hypothetical protein
VIGRPSIEFLLTGILQAINIFSINTCSWR